MINYIHDFVTGIGIDISLKHFTLIIELMIVLTVSLLAGWAVKMLLTFLFHRLNFQYQKTAFIGLTLTSLLAQRISHIIVPIIWGAAFSYLLSLKEEPLLFKLLSMLALIALIVTTVRAIFSLLENLANFQDHRIKQGANTLSIKSYVQLIKIIIFCLAIIMTIAIVLDKSPLVLLTGLGALSAVLMLVFKDTILSFVASLQLSNMLRVGDWIEMQSQGADGEVIDLSLHTVTIKNWNNTHSCIPTIKFVSESFINWRGMQESGGRRIRRNIYIDLASIRPLTRAEISKLKKIELTRAYLTDELIASAASFDMQAADFSLTAQQDFITNLGAFRHYVESYLAQHPKIRRDMTLLVKLEEPTSTGIPMQIYCFTNTVVWLEYEAIQDAIFEYLLAIMPLFSLTCFQRISSADARDLNNLTVANTAS